MGEIAEAVIDGELCQECQAYIGPGEGYPRTCGACQHTATSADIRKNHIERTNCHVCNKRIKKAGLADHMRVMHPRVVEESAAHLLDKMKSALLWTLWHHQGGSSHIGQPIRKLLGIGQHDRMTDEQVAQAKAFGQGENHAPNGL